MRARWMGGGRLLGAAATAREPPPRAAGLVLPRVPLARPPERDDPVLRLVVDRALAGSRPGARSDAARVALAIEGGGMAGAISGGMCAALEALGLIDSFDVIYGSSAGAINASYTAAGQAQLCAPLYVAAAQDGLVDLRRVLRALPPFRLAEVFNSLLHAHPHASKVLERAPALRLTAARIEDKRLDVLGDFESVSEVRMAAWASSAIPVLGGDIVEFRGQRYVDGGLIESLPYGAALREGATHVLVLRSRPAGHRKKEYQGAQRRVVDRLLRSAPDTVVEMVFERSALYNAEASSLESLESARLAGRVSQLTPPVGAQQTSQLEARPERLLACIALGARTVYRALAAGVLTEPVIAAGSAA